MRSDVLDRLVSAGDIAQYVYTDDGDERLTIVFPSGNTITVEGGMLANQTYDTFLVIGSKVAVKP